ncbi:hypothetical protein I3F58_21490 [Streptomyces sp. MUM 203J]|uniref:hypothetical protein n=1 Tax=Streptomyces sp. MUM 203J TaxID=2791990 RepID=UPI001F03D25D|nr:hypothetical protein [Streptomyces sp. MUM 203J]MCH0542087.1 hypothetical protein [Streptomyces sp. MUM 203J]
MRTRTRPALRTVLTAVVGGLLAALALVPSARADGHDLTPPEILAVSVNGGRPVVVGPRHSLTFPVTVVARADAGIHRHGVEVVLWGPGDRVGSPRQELFGLDAPAPGCSPTSATTAVCTEWFRIDSGSARVTNDWAGSWTVRALVASNNLREHPERSITIERFPDAFNLQRKSRLTFVATPNPLPLGRSLGLFGRLLAADWELNRYTGRSGETVELQFCASPCRMVESVRSLGTGVAGFTGTSYPATRDGSWWLRYRGGPMFSPTSSPGVRVDVV